MQIIHQAPLAALSMGAAFTVFYGVADPVAAFAEVQTVEADGYYVVGDGPDENMAVARERAKADARQKASEKAGVFVESLSEVKMGELTRDEVKTISANVLEVLQDEPVTPVPIQVETSTGPLSVLRLHCHMVAKVDTANVMAEMRQSRQQLDEAVQHNKQMEKELARINAEIASLKEKYKTATESQKQKINQEVKRNEREFEAEEWNRKGRAFYVKGKHAQAIECYLKAVELAPNNSNYWNNLGQAYGDTGDKDNWIRCMNKAIDLNVQNAYPYSNLGVYHYNEGNYEKAKGYFEKAIELKPDFATAWGNLGNTYGHLGNKEKYLECHRKAVAFDPKDPYRWSGLGGAYKYLKNYNKAIECYRKAVELDKDHAWGWEGMGDSYMKLEKYGRAIGPYRKAAALCAKDAR